MGFRRMKRVQIAILAGVVLAIVCYVVYNQTASRYEKEFNRVLEQERNEYWDKIGILEKNVVELQEELALHKEAIVPKEKLAEVFGEGAAIPSPEKNAISCEELERQITAVFTYLDKKEYVALNNLEGGTYALFKKTARLLSERPPMVSGEMKDILSLTRNVAHFYRVLGEPRIELFKEVMNNESEIVESAMATFFAWFVSCGRCHRMEKRCLSLEALYQYAGFFLNTLAGKSYLLRRDSKVRVLMSYYCVLILDRANQEKLNTHGIDIRHFIYSLFYDIMNHKGLVHQKEYLDKLEGLRKKYQT
jgi:hypothetical protein